MEIIVPGNTKDRIESVWAWISKDEDGKEGIVAGIGGMPMIASEKRIVERATGVVKAAIAQAPGYTAELVEFKRV